jgi:hypothetical protein
MAMQRLQLGGNPQRNGTALYDFLSPFCWAVDGCIGQPNFAGIVILVRNDHQARPAAGFALSLACMQPAYSFTCAQRHAQHRCLGHRRGNGSFQRFRYFIYPSFGLCHRFQRANVFL